METFKILYTLFGGLGIFFYGMKTMSNALQQEAGDVISNVINSLTSNRVLAVMVGIIVTMIVQSSSVTTVMVVGFVNAGLMQLTQAIGVIFGSNIGTTITGWIISIKVGKYGLLFIGLGIFPVLFSKNTKFQNIGKVLFGVGMIFMGLETMSSAFKPLRSNESFLELVSYFSEPTYLSYLASIAMGCVLTVIIQSSSAMLGITIALANTGVINFPTAAALVLGENIGTTITALLASVGTTITAKRAARAHAIFNLLGVGAVFAFFPLYVDFIEQIIPSAADFIDKATGQKPNIAQHIAASHTIFNVSATLLFLPFLNFLARFVTRITPDKTGKEKEEKRLILIGNDANILPATALVQAQQEVEKMSDIIGRMHSQTKIYLSSNKSSLLEKIKSYEVITDNQQKEITLFLVKLMEKSLSRSQSTQSLTLMKVADELESIADYFERIAKYKRRFINNKESLPNKDEYFEFLDKVWSFYELCTKDLASLKAPNSEEAKRLNSELEAWANDIRDRHLVSVTKGQYSALSSLTFSDMVVALRKIRAHTYNIAKALEGSNVETAG